jgi:hypothetical protein
LRIPAFLDDFVITFARNPVLCLKKTFVMPYAGASGPHCHAPKFQSRFKPNKIKESNEFRRSNIIGDKF